MPCHDFNMSDSKTMNKADNPTEHPGIIARDAYLQPFEKAINGRHQRVIDKRRELLAGSGDSLAGFANGHTFFGLHKTQDGWIFREWAPHAEAVYLIGDFNRWTEEDAYRARRIDDAGVWELTLPHDSLRHGDFYKLKIKWNGGEGERIPAWAQRVVQDENTKIFSAQVWCPDEPYRWQTDHFRPSTDPLLIYECHIGMSQDAEKVGTYTEFKDNVLPRVIEGGYNCIQLMAIQEHPYYGSFGYHVSSFFAPSGRFGTPEELKALIDEAHQNGVAVIMDIVHSHSVKNEAEGLANFAGDPAQFFHGGDRRLHPAWDSLCFDYGKNEVLHFLLSNCKYWMEEFRFDGFRFDGVTSMLYYSHGLEENFTGYGDYFNGRQDDDAICYLSLANLLVHEVNPRAITIAEEVSGMPGLAAAFEDGGMGFDYRMAMNIPDYWIKLIKEKKDEDWKPFSIYWETTNRRADEKTISYCESHDQALVGDKTIIFRLIDADMYWHFKKGDENEIAHRGIALHKMIRLVTCATINGGYLTFMGNEFGHPEWIDFPREGNGWSHHYAQRQWHLADDEQLCYHELGAFDRAMIKLIRGEKGFQRLPLQEVWHDDNDQILAFMRQDYVFVFNFSPAKSFAGYGFLVPPGSYRVVLNTDNPAFGGFGLTDDTVSHLTIHDPLYEGEKKEWLKLYIPARSAVVLKRMD